MALNWKKVTHIKICEGTRGGRYYFLTLECGHFKSIAIPPFREYMMMVPFKPRNAPEKVICPICGRKKK